MRRKRSRTYESWLPIDSRLIPHIISFGHVKGTARIFLQVEIILSVLIILGVLVIVALRLVY